jgi:3-oxoadipate enol-lactonase
MAGATTAETINSDRASDERPLRNMAALASHATAGDGTRIYFEVFSPSGEWLGPPQAEDRQVVLLVMGLGATGRLWAPAVRFLVEAGHSVITVDNRGCGYSSTPSLPWTTRTMARDAVGVMDHLGIERAHVGSASLGGMIAQELALEFPERVISLVLGCTTGGLPRLDLYARISPSRVLHLVRRAISPPDDPSTKVTEFLRWSCTEEFVAECHPGSDAWETVAAMFDDPSSGRGLAFQVLAAIGHSSWSRLHRLTMPVQIHHGTEDPLIPFAAGRELARHIPNSELVVHPGAGHALVLDRPEQSAEKIRAFLAECEELERGDRAYASA